MLEINDKAADYCPVILKEEVDCNILLNPRFSPDFVIWLNYDHMLCLSDILILFNIPT